MPALQPLQMTGHPHSGTGAYLPCDLNISAAPLRVKIMHFGCQREEPLHALHGQISGFVRILSASHGPNSSAARGIKPYYIILIQSSSRSKMVHISKSDPILRMVLERKNGDNAKTVMILDPIWFLIQYHP
jgi:hypothetical protein